MFVGAADADRRRTGIPEQKVRERIAAPLTVEREVAARVVRVDGVEHEMEHVSAELEPVAAAVVHHVVVQLIAAVVARHERRRIAHRAELASERHLRIPHVPRIRRDALQS